MNDKKQSRIRRHSRIRSTVSGTSDRPRLAIFRSNTNIYAQIIDDGSGKTLASSSTKGLKAKTFIERAKEAGKSLAKIATEKNIKTVVFDRGGFIYTGKVKAFAEGAREGGLVF